MTGRRGAVLLLAALLLVLLLGVAAPLATLLLKSLQDRDGEWVGLLNFSSFLASPTLLRAAGHSLTMALVTLLVTLILAFPVAYGLTRSRMKLAGPIGLVLQLPLLAPSLLPALSLVTLFGNQGLWRGVLLGHSLYGPVGIVVAEIFYCLPHALMILCTALSVADARLYDAAQSLGAGRLRRFLSITLPGARYGMVAAAFVVFSLVLTDFGIPKVLGGSYDVLATEVFQQVVGQQNFGMGAVVGIVLLLPALLAFLAEGWGARRQAALLSARSMPYRPRRDPVTDIGLLAFCLGVALMLLIVFLVAVYASLVKLWPYNLQLTLANYDFGRFDESGWQSLVTSLQLALLTAIAGTPVMLAGAYLVEKLPGLAVWKSAYRLLAVLPLGIPGMVLGLAYIFFFTGPVNPMTGLYGSMALLVLATCVHFYSVGHLTLVTALKQQDSAFEAVSASLKVPLWLSFWRVSLPLCLPAVLDVAAYLFVNAMTTVSAMVFLYTPEHKPASVAILAMDDAGAVAPAAAMAVLVALAAALVRAAHDRIGRQFLRRTQPWRPAGATIG
jgi:iron(III) transport system permease protein